jgi:hypothetical protein
MTQLSPPGRRRAERPSDNPSSDVRSVAGSAAVRETDSPGIADGRRPHHGRRSGRRWPAVATWVITAALCGGCLGGGGAPSEGTASIARSLASPTALDCRAIPQPTGPRITTPPDEYEIDVGNDTDLTLALDVNGATVTTVHAHGGAGIPAAQLPPLPWDIRLRTSTGRIVLSLAAHAGDLWREPCGNNVLGARADLSCGRLDLYIKVPMLGPVPGPGTPGDCNP